MDAYLQTMDALELAQTKRPTCTEAKQIERGVWCVFDADGNWLVTVALRRGKLVITKVF